MKYLMALSAALLLGFDQNLQTANAGKPPSNQIVTGTIVDAATQKQIPARVHLRDDQGKWLLVETQGGKVVHYDHQRLPGSPEVHAALSADPFQINLPPGEYEIRIERGKEYLPLIRKVTVADQPLNLKFELKRWINMASRGWYSGDTHVHRKVSELPTVMLAEDLNVALPLTYWVTKSDTAPSRGDKNADTRVAHELINIDANHVIYPVNTEYEIFSVGQKQHTLGAVFVLNHKTPFPMGAPPVAPIARMARAESALLDLDKHSWEWSLMIIPVMNVDLYQLANNHHWQTQFGFPKWTLQTIPDYMQIERDVDGMTEWGWTDFGFKTYYALLNSGFRLRVTAGTASGVHPVQLGFNRVYVQLGENDRRQKSKKPDFSYAKWIAGLNAGRSFVSNGPMLEATFNDKLPGTTFRPTREESFVVNLSATASSSKKLKSIEVIVNGEATHSYAATNRKKSGAFESKISTQLSIPSSSWIAVRCFEEHEGGRVRFAHTNPVFVDIPNRPQSPKRVEVEYFIARIQDEMKRNQGVLKASGMAEFQTALNIYQALLKKSK